MRKDKAQKEIEVDIDIEVTKTNLPEKPQKCVLITDGEYKYIDAE
jgi:hypothetical protein